MRGVTAVACSNFALCKYWGKADGERPGSPASEARWGGANLPAVPSLSMTVDALRTRTTVEEAPGSTDVVSIDGRPAGDDARARVVRHLDLLRQRAGSSRRVNVRSESTFPAGAGLASSASAFAALTAAAARLLDLPATLDELSDLARRASASAARSIHGGFVELPSAVGEEGLLAAHPVPVAPGLATDLRLLVLVTSESPKAVGSRDGMNRTAATSPYHEAWIHQAPSELQIARAALEAGDLPALGEAMERSALRMHASALAASPGILYWNGATVEALAAVRRLRERGLPAWFTIDAGPHVKVLCCRDDAGRLVCSLGAVRGVLRVIQAGVGPAVEVSG